jgi:hypothetical protein
MKTNCGTIDRTLRIVIGVAGVGIALSGLSVWGWLGLVPLATGGTGLCLLYLPFGISTKKGA